MIYQEYKKENLLRERSRHRQYNRERRLNSTKYRWTGVKKRPYPGYCEICGRRKEKNLHYHHWDDSRPYLGMWLCGSCHGSATVIEHKFNEQKYLELKDIITMVHGSACGEHSVGKRVTLGKSSALS